MKSSAAHSSFWDFLDRLIDSSRVIIDRPKGSRHPRYSSIIYPVDYGYLEGTTTVDGAGIDVWQGESGSHDLTCIILTIDGFKRDAEPKLLLGCSETEIDLLYDFQNSGDMRALLIWRSDPKGEIP